jgi:hypothetical protein
MLFKRGDRVRVTRDFEAIPSGTKGLVIGLDLDKQVYWVTILESESDESGAQQVPPEFLEADEG